METREDPDSGRSRHGRPPATRRSLLAATAGLLGTIGVIATGETVAAKRRGRDNRTRNKNQSSATSTSTGGAGGAGGNAGSIDVVCDPGFENCQIVDGPA